MQEQQMKAILCAYRITYYEDEESTTPTGYYDGYGQWKKEDGALRIKLDDGVDTVEHNGKKYIIHPAFDNNLEMGGWSNKLPGFWFAKFEMSGATATALKSTYGVQAEKNLSLGKAYTNARTATYGYTGTTDSFDNKTSFMNSHIIKNSEWGAVAYLTHSRYGRDGQEITINNSPSYTAGAAEEGYKENTNQSTTGNVYGIYDMSGGSAEYTTGYNSLDSSNYYTNTYIGWGTATGLTTKSESTKYATKYDNTTSSSYGNNTLYKTGKIGDGTKEVHRGGAYVKTDTKNYFGWFADYAFVLTATSPFLERGGARNGENSGVFSVNYGVGGVYRWTWYTCNIMS